MEIILIFLAVVIIASLFLVNVIFLNSIWFNIFIWIISLVLFILWFISDRNQIIDFLTIKKSKYGLNSSKNVIFFIFILILIAYISNLDKIDKKFDISKYKLNTLSVTSKELSKTIPKNIKILGFFENINLKYKFKKLISLYRDINVYFDTEYINPIKFPKKAVAEKLISPNTVIIKLDAKSVRLNSFDEESFINALLYLIKSKNKSISFTRGHGEPKLSDNEPLGFDLIVKELKVNMYKVSTIDILEDSQNSADLLIIAGPKYDFKTHEIKFLKNYIKNGKALFFLLDALGDIKNIADFLKNYGISINNDFLTLDYKDPKSRIYGQNNVLISSLNKFHPISRYFEKNGNVDFLIPFTRSLNIDKKSKFKLSIIARTNIKTNRILDVLNSNDLKNINLKKIKKGSYPFLVSSEGVLNNKKFKILVAGSSHFARNYKIKNALENKDLFFNSIKFLLNDRDFISIKTKKNEPGKLNISSNFTYFLFIFFSYFYSFFILIFSFLNWKLRENNHIKN